MELGATLCTPRAPRCPACPWTAHCAARAQGLRGTLPVRSRPAPVRRVEAVAVFLERHDRVLAVQRPQRGLLGGLWELPGGELRDGEPPARALARALREGVGLGLSAPEPLGAIEHAFTHRLLRLHVYRATSGRGARPAHGLGRTPLGVASRARGAAAGRPHAQGARALQTVAAAHCRPGCIFAACRAASDIPSRSPRSARATAARSASSSTAVRRGCRSTPRRSSASSIAAGPARARSPRRARRRIASRSSRACFEGVTLGTPIALLVRNQDARPSAYEHMKDVYRPSHADFTTERSTASATGRAAAARARARRSAASRRARSRARCSRPLAGVEVLAWVHACADVEAQDRSGRGDAREPSRRTRCAAPTRPPRPRWRR